MSTSLFQNSCNSCGWTVAPNMHAVAHEGFRFYCHRCHDRIIKEARKAHKERLAKLAAETENVKDEKTI
jgi:predicted RNA-binding Zn-ribbon protein involved in translation (DUF1610 family)